MMLIQGIDMETWGLELAIALGTVIFVYSVYELHFLLVTCILKSLHDARPYQYPQEQLIIGSRSISGVFT